MGDFMEAENNSSFFVLLILLLTFSFDKDMDALLEEFKNKDKKLYENIKSTLDREEFKNLFKNLKKDIDIF